MSKQSKAGAIPILPPLAVASSEGEDSLGNRPADKAADSKAADEKADQGAEGQGSQPNSAPGGQYQAHGHHEVSEHRFLSVAEWSTIANRIGGVRDAEQHKPVHPTNWWWPPWGMPRGLYRDIVTQRCKYYYLFHATSLARASLMVLQLLLGAALTSLEPMSLKDGTPITILGAANTVIAGLLALMHNSGLPDRFRYDMFQFDELEDHVKEILDSGLAPADQTTSQVLAVLFDVFREAKATVAANMPASYNSRRGSRGPRAAPPAPQPSAELPSPAGKGQSEPQPSSPQPSSPPPPKTPGGGEAPESQPPGAGSSSKK